MGGSRSVRMWPRPRPVASAPCLSTEFLLVRRLLPVLPVPSWISHIPLVSFFVALHGALSRLFQPLGVPSRINLLPPLTDTLAPFVEVYSSLPTLGRPLLRLLQPLGGPSCNFVDNSFSLRALRGQLFYLFRGQPPAPGTSPAGKSRAESVRLCCMIGRIRVQPERGTVSGWCFAPLFSWIPSLFPSANRGQSWPGSIAGK